MTLFISPKVYIDLNDDGDFADAGEDVSADVHEASWTRGRASVNDQFGMGTASIALVNTSSDYSPFDSGASTYPNLVPGRQVKLELVHNAVTYPAFYGRLARVTQDRTPDGAPLVRLELEDEFGRMSRSHYRSSGVLLTTSFGGSPSAVLKQHVANLGILEDYGYNAGGYTVEDSKAISFSETAFARGFWFHGGSHLEAGKLAAKNEVGGAFFMAADGKPTFYNREHNSAAALHATFTGPQALLISNDQSDYYDSVVVKRAGLDVDPDETAIFQLFPTGRVLETGSTHPSNTFGGEYISPAATVTQPEPTTDYTVNAISDGSGEDLTDKVSISSWTSFGGGFQVTFNNASGQTGYLTLFKVRGYQTRQTSEAREIIVSDSSAPVKNQPFRDEFVFVDNVRTLRGYAKFKLYAGTTYYPRRIRVRLAPRTDAEAVSILGLELLKRVHITNTTGLYPSQIDEDFFVQGIRGRAVRGGHVEMDCDLWHEIASLGNFFRISGVSTYSQIAGDAATTGSPIGY
jgi:hypothetical protein